MTPAARMPGAGELPLVLQPNAGGLDLTAWAAAHRDFIGSLLLKHGGLLFRGFDVHELSQFEAFVRAVSGEPVGYVEQTSPRGKLHGNIYSSTEYPPRHRIFLHNENSYATTWPLKIAFPLRSRRRERWRNADCGCAPRVRPHS